MEVTELKKQCPFCGEEILSTAKKCKHCGEWLEGKPDIETPVNDSNKKSQEDETSLFVDIIVGTLIFGGIGWALFYFGSWNLILGKKINLLSVTQFKNRSFIFADDGFVFRFNEKYFGFIKGGQFFDSPFIQWIMLLLSLSAFALAIHWIFTRTFGIDD
jgi:hypothetical protein